MENFFEEISSYNLLNNILPGSVFGFCFSYFFNMTIGPENIFERLFFYYFIGMIISRIGSLVIEPILEKIKLVEEIDYYLFIEGSKKDKKVEVLQESKNLYRSVVSLCFILLVIGLFLLRNNTDLLFCYKYCAIFALMILFILAYRKQMHSIIERCNFTNNTEREEKNVSE